MTEPATCGKCGTPISPGQRFCAGCGADVSGAQGNVATAFVSKQDMARATMSATALHEVLRHATIGEYEVLAELGRGGMATVYLGHDIALDRKVAIKVMSPALLAGEGMVERFKREARTAASLSHPNIIPIYAVKEGDQIVYFVMKFVEGRPLDSIIKETGKLPIQMVQQILQQVGAGLGYAHKRGIIHRDVKPANVMVDTEGWAVVTDFGIAKVTETKGLTMTGATVGTPSYMSPEQCAAKELTGASDQYSLGVLAYEMIAGKLPFNADSIMAIMYSHFNDPPPSLLEVRPDCPPEIAKAVMRMLAKEPGDRFPTVEDAISAIGVPALTPDDPVRTQLMTLAASHKNTEMLRSLVTPVSMPGGTRAGKSTVSTTGGTGFTIAPQQVSVSAGGAVQLTAKLKGTGGKTLMGPRVTWASTAPEIATITPQGLVSALAEGEVLITCTCEGASATATVIVTHAEGKRSRRAPLVAAIVLVAAAGIALAVLQPWAPKTPLSNAAQQTSLNPAPSPSAPKTDSTPKQVAQSTPPVVTRPTPQNNQPAGRRPAPTPNPTRQPVRQVVTPPRDTQAKVAVQTPAQTPTKPEPAPAASSTPAPPTPPPPQPILPGDIQAAIGGYESAIESGKVERVRAAYPGMT
ncbi:MAG TPA: protein kinase, partial [Gemmatimonadales bacterium]|nr:protein kinase [Gemmatimonadales bacterium]